MQVRNEERHQRKHRGPDLQVCRYGRYRHPDPIALPLEYLVRHKSQADPACPAQGRMSPETGGKHVDDGLSKNVPSYPGAGEEAVGLDRTSGRLCLHDEESHKVVEGGTDEMTLFNFLNVFCYIYI